MIKLITLLQFYFCKAHMYIYIYIVNRYITTLNIYFRLGCTSKVSRINSLLHLHPHSFYLYSFYPIVASYSIQCFLQIFDVTETEFHLIFSEILLIHCFITWMESDVARETDRQPVYSRQFSSLPTALI